MDSLIQQVLNEYASKMEISPEEKLKMLIDILTAYLKSKNCLK